MVTYKNLVGMVLRLVAAGMNKNKAIDEVVFGYVCDRDSLVEWVQNHTVNP